MNIGEYISQKLGAFGNVSEALLLDMSFEGRFSLKDEYCMESAKSVGIALIACIEELVYAPKVTSVSESGFSMSWDFAGLGKYYLWLCRKWGVTPNDDSLGLLGISSIKDCSDIW